MDGYYGKGLIKMTPGYTEIVFESYTLLLHVRSTKRGFDLVSITPTPGRSSSLKFEGDGLAK